MGCSSSAGGHTMGISYAVQLLWSTCTSWLLAVINISGFKLSQEMLIQKQTAGSKTAVKLNSECFLWLHFNPYFLLQLAVQHNLKLTSICISIAVKSEKENHEGDWLASQCLHGPIFSFLTTPQVLMPLALQILHRKEHIWMQHRINFFYCTSEQAGVWDHKWNIGCVLGWLLPCSCAVMWMSQ